VSDAEAFTGDVVEVVTFELVTWCKADGVNQYVQGSPVAF